jgi:hypothetical protein
MTSIKTSSNSTRLAEIDTVVAKSLKTTINRF